MRIIKLALLSFIIFFLLITGISLFIPSHIRISKAIDISANKDSALSKISEAAKWKYWYPGADTSEFFFVEGKIKGIRTGNMQSLVIKTINDSTVIAFYAGPKSKIGETGWNIIAGNIPNRITVQWYMDFHLRWYPWEKFSSLMFENRYGPLMEKGLANLKALLEK